MATPSLAMIPSGYKDGTLYSVLPNNAGGDFNVTRGSLATRVNKNGLIEPVGTLGADVVLNGDFAQGSQEWVLTDGVSITAQGARITSDGTFQDIQQANVLVIGDTYEIEYEITESVNGTIGFTSNFGNLQLKNTVGVHKFYGVAQNSTTLQIKRSTSPTDITIDNIKVKRLNGDDTPRIDYTDGGCPVLLTEPQSTNLLTDSNDFSKWITAGDTTVEGGYLSPDGTNNAYKVSGTDSALTRGATSETGTRTIYARTVSGTGTAHLCSYHGNTDNLFTITEDWQRFEVNAVVSTGGTNFYGIDFRGNTTLTEILLYGAQLEELSYATSYIPTYGAVRTRLQDTVTGAGTSSDFNSTEGVLFAEISAYYDGIDKTEVSITDGSSSNKVSARFNQTSGILRVFVRSGGATQIDEQVSISDGFLKLALKYKLNDFSLWVNGLEVATSASGASPIGLSKLNLDNGVGGSPFFGKTSQIQVFKTALSDFELTQLTTI